MPSDFKKNLSLERFLAEAARRRVSDVAFKTFDQQTIDSRASTYLNSRNKKVVLPAAVGTPLSSRSLSTFIKDSKLSLIHI